MTTLGLPLPPIAFITARRKSRKLVAAGAILGDLGAFRRENPVAGGGDRGFVGDLGQAEFRDGCLGALARLAHRGERGLGGVEADARVLDHLQQRAGLLRLAAPLRRAACRAR